MNTADALALGLRHHQAGDLPQAEQLYRQVLASDPHHGEALQLLGLLALQSGRPAAGIEYLRQVLRLDPNCAEAHFNLGSALRVQGQTDEAIASYQQALALRASDARTHANLGHALRERGRFPEAIDHYKISLRLDPNQARVHRNLGALFGEQGLLVEAETYFRSAVQLDPNDVKTHLALARTLGEQGRHEEALACCGQAMRLHPDNPATRFALAALTGAGRPQTAPREYVLDLFDHYTGVFDAHLLNKLGYRGPQLLRAAVGDLAGPNTLDILDLGCGTGLCGEAFRDLARTLTGVDLSARMLAQARARGPYHRLIEGDLLGALNAGPESYDLILASDVFIYVGDLSAVFPAARRALRPGGRFVLLVEAHEGEGFVLRTTMRFAHSLAYLRDLTRSAGLIELSVTKAAFRKERGQDVEGYVVVLGCPKRDQEPWSGHSNQGVTTSR